MSQPRIFIDANKYLSFYEGEEISVLIEPLLALRDSLFITRSIHYEVTRRRLGAAITHLTAGKKTGPRGPVAASDLEDLTEEEKRSRRAAAEVSARANEDEQKRLDAESVEILRQIAEGRDSVTKLLAPLFDRALAETEDDLSKARLRRELGNPPGKLKNPLGDQLNWEQFLKVLPGSEIVWLITGDGDFCTTLKDGSIVLNPYLHDELNRLTGGRCKVRCFSSLTDGILDAIRELNPAKPVALSAVEIQASRESESSPARHVPKIIALLRHSPHSFDYLRNRGIQLSDDEFRALPKNVPALRLTHIIDRDKRGVVINRRPGFHSVRFQ